MELRQYWRIIWRRWWLVAVLVLGVLIVSLITHQEPAARYQANMRFAIGIEGQAPVNAVSGEGRSDAWLASEYLADDLSEVVKGGDFAARISERVGFAVPAGAIFATREHRIMTVNITWGDPAQVVTIAEAVAAEIESAGQQYFPQLEDVQAEAVLIDGPGIGQVGRSLREKLDLPLRLFIALIAGVALAFLWDYLDDTVRERSELESLGLQVLGEIPRSRRFWSRRDREGS
ncbi:MAG: YveK family protein [Anaerolineae bacterium]|jgi:capsular polysaccharide biosynthesis protein